MKQLCTFVFSSCFFLGAATTVAAQTAAPVVPAAAPPLTHRLVHDATGDSITVAEVQAEATRLPEANRAQVLGNPNAIEQLVTNLLVRRLLAKEALRDGLDKDALTQSSLAMARDRVLSDARLAKIDQQNAPGDAALEAHARNVYQAGADARFALPAQTRASHILIENKGPESLTKARDLLKQIRAGASFEELAKANSADAGTAARGGSLGFFGPGQMVRPFEDATNALQKPGDLSEPIETQFGYHIIRLDERQAKRRTPFEEVRAALINEARVALINEARNNKATSLTKGFAIDRTAIEALSSSADK